MSDLIVNGLYIEPYMPRTFSDRQKSEAYNLTLDFKSAVERQVPIAFSYNNSPRLIRPHSLFIQNRTPDTMTEIRKPTDIHTKMRFYKKWARRAIGLDADQLFSKQESPRNGWKTFHIDRVDDLRLMTLDEIRSIFQISDDQIADDIHLTDGFTVAPDFIGNWNHWFRRFLAQVPSQYKL